MVEAGGDRKLMARMLFSGKVGVEIGTEQGEFAEVICQVAKKLYCVDAWKAYKGYRDHTRQRKLEAFYEATLERLKPYYNWWVIRRFSMEALDQFPNEFLDFVYIDANHSYDSVTEDIEGWIKKVKPGGIVSGHDYIRRKGQDQYYAVKDAVDDYVAAHGKELIIWRGESPASWSFVK